MVRRTSDSADSSASGGLTQRLWKRAISGWKLTNAAFPHRFHHRLMEMGAENQFLMLPAMSQATCPGKTYLLPYG